MSDLKGVVESTNSKPITTKYGKKNKIGLKIEGNWYNVLLGDDVDAAKYKGKLVSFSYSETDYGKSIDAKTLKVAENAGTASHTGGAKAKGDYNVGVKVGHAINNGVTMAIAAKAAGSKAPLLQLAEVYAAEIIKLSLRLEASYEEIAETAQAEQELGEAEGEPEPEQQAEPAPEKPKEKPKAVAKKPAAKPAEKAPEKPAEDVGFDDDIPF